MARNASKKPAARPIEDYEMHGEFSRPTLPTGEYSGIATEELLGRPTPNVSYSLERSDTPDLSEEFAARDSDLDPQYIWRGKQPGGAATLETAAPFIYQQEKIFPRLLIEEMKRQTAIRRDAADAQLTFAALSEDFDPNARPSFYEHEEGWKNRMILGDSLQVMASLAENERLRGKVQMIYFDPPYGIKFNSNWQPSTKSTNVKDGKKEDITREPEMVKAFRDTWHDGIHSYLGYLRDRLTVARDLLTESGSVFVQISDENSHRIRCVLDEVFGSDNYVSTIIIKKASPESRTIKNACNYVLWVAKNKKVVKVRKIFRPRKISDGTTEDPKKLALWAHYPSGFERPLTTAEKRGEIQLDEGVVVFRADKVRDDAIIEDRIYEFDFRGERLLPGNGHCWRGDMEQMSRLEFANRLMRTKETLAYKYYMTDNGGVEWTNVWDDTAGKIVDMCYVVQTNEKIVARCMLMTSDPGDLVLDPTCGSGTTATVAETYGRRWITIDTSRVALVIARRRLMTSLYPYYLLADSEAGLKKEMEITGRVIQRPTSGKISQGFVYQRVPHITLKAIANNSEIDTIWEKYEAESERLRKELGVNTARPESAPYQEWEVPFDVPEGWSEEAKKLHGAFMEMKRKRQKEIDDSIARTAETEYLYDKPYEDKKRVRVAGPFTVESIAPVRSLVSEADGTLSDPAVKLANSIDYGNGANYVTRMIRTLRRNGVKQARKSDRITFLSVEPWANGKHIAAEAWGEAGENGKSKRYAVAFGPEFGSVTRRDVREASREALECGFDVLIYCAFNFEAYVEEGSESSMGRLKVLQARMNSDLHMSTDLKDTGSGNPFVIFGEPDIALVHTEDDLFTVEIKGVDVYDPKRNEVRSDNSDAIDCWMLDTDYSGEAFFARQVYFPGREDVYKAFKVFLKNDIDEEEWASVARSVSRPFARPKSGQIAVKVINHFGDEVMKIFEVK